MSHECRKRKNPDDTNSNNYNSNEPSTKRRRLSPNQLDLVEYECTACKELGKQYFQCTEGHLICSNCYPKLNKCPLCRVKLTTRIRNRLAERALELREVPCTNNGCDEWIVFSRLEQHISSECGFCVIKCRYHTLGCQWSGILKNESKHKIHCKQNLDLDNVLKIVEENKKYKQMVQNCEDMAALHFTLPSLDTDASNIYFKKLSSSFDWEDFVFKMRMKLRRENNKYDMFIKLRGLYSESGVGEAEDLLFNIMLDIDIEIWMEPTQFTVQLNGNKPETEWIKLTSKSLRKSDIEQLLGDDSDSEIRLKVFWEMP